MEAAVVSVMMVTVVVVVVIEALSWHQTPGRNSFKLKFLPHQFLLIIFAFESSCYAPTTTTTITDKLI